MKTDMLIVSDVDLKTLIEMHTIQENPILIRH